jgi:hypothetical protein
MCTERKLHSNWHSPTDTPSLSPTVVAGLRVRYSRRRSSPETFFVRKICSWTDLFVMRGVREPRFDCIWIRVFVVLVHLFEPFLGAFTKLRKATVSFVVSIGPSVLPSVCMQQLGFHWTDFHQILYLGIFLKYVIQFQVSLKSDKNNRYFIYMWQCTF